jgi:GntR family transcriptional regulator
MQLRISDRDGVPIYVQLVRQIKYLVSSGQLVADEQLPPVRKLAEQLLINPNTVARAYREMESAGIVTSRQGSGVFVAEGISPLARREQDRILQARIDTLLTEARQLGVDVETVIRLIRQREGSLRHE